MCACFLGCIGQPKKVIGYFLKEEHKMNVKKNNTVQKTLALIPALMLAAGTSYANTTNNIPYEEDFESIASGTALVGSNGWYGASNTYAIVTNLDYSAHYSNYYPLPGSTHSNVMQLQTEGNVITNELEDLTDDETKSSATNVWFDSVIRFNQWSEDSYPDAITSNDQVQCAFFVNTNDRLVVHHYDWDTGSSTGSNIFTVITNSAITNGQYTRITVKMDYLTDRLDFDPTQVENTYYQLYIDTTLVTNSAAYQSPDTGSGKPGTWFMSANKGYAKKYITGLSFAGNGIFDDMIVTTNDTFGPSYTISTEVNDSARGDISPSTDTVPEGLDSTEFSITANNGYYVAQLLTNSVQVFTNSDETLLSTNYIWPSVMADGTVTVDFAEATTTYMITSTVAVGTGTVTPAMTNVYPGRDATFNMVADDHSHLDGLWTNGTAVGGPWDNSATNVSYGWLSIVADGTLTVSFAENIWSNDTPETWLDSFYGSTNYDAAAVSDSDGDGQEAWAEYLAGTDPTDSNSVLRIDDTWHENGTNYLKWVSHHVGDQTSLPPYNVVYATNLLNADWSVVTDTVQRTEGTHTNIWSWESTQGAFYRIVATNQ